MGPWNTISLSGAAASSRRGSRKVPIIVQQENNVDAFCRAVCQGDVSRVKELLALDHVRSRINDPMFDFGQRAAHVAAKNQALLTVLLDAGADVNLRSDWANGPYTVLDQADEGTARFLLARGARLTANVAARLGWTKELTLLVDADASVVNTRGGDGQQPLHEAKTVAIAAFLLERGADIEGRCIDHRSTAAQYALVDRPDVTRFLIERGATPDIFMAARLGDASLAARLLASDPTAVSARVNQPGYAPVQPFNIYCWTLGFDRSPHDIALAYGHRAVHDVLVAHSSPRIRFLTAVSAANAEAAEAALAQAPSLIASLSTHDHARLAHAIFHEHFAEAHLMIRLGFDPTAPGVDGGTALHAACWVGNVDIVDLLLARGGVRLDARDPTHHSTLLGWTAFGSVHRRAKGADYPAVAKRLVAAGADIHAIGNKAGLTLLQMAEGNPTMQDALRSLGAE